jgi:acetyl esterase/lipase
MVNDPSSVFSEHHPIWPQGSRDGEAPDAPRLSVFLPPAERRTGMGLLVLPGGGYCGRSEEKEGSKIAERFGREGIACFMLSYRHAPNRHPIPLRDAQRGMRYLRASAGRWGLDPARLGVIGFSAGGHLAASLGVYWDEGDAASPDPVQRASCRPDFLLLIYPVITMRGPATHGGSRQNLLGDSPSEELMRATSVELHVAGRTPPTFLFHTGADESVPAEHSLMFYQALRAAKVGAELHIFTQGGHGVGLAEEAPGLRLWPQLAIEWLAGRGLCPSDRAGR